MASGRQAAVLPGHEGSGALLKALPRPPRPGPTCWPMTRRTTVGRGGGAAATSSPPPAAAGAGGVGGVEAGGGPGTAEPLGLLHGCRSALQRWARSLVAHAGSGGGPGLLDDCGVPIASVCI